MQAVQDTKVPFPAYIIKKPRTKTDQRRVIAEMSLSWLLLQHKRGARGAVMVDIDDTLIDGNETVQHGFEFMKILYEEASYLFPIHVVTARPEETRDIVMKLLKDRKFCIPPDRLHMLPTELYGEDLSHVERFKWNVYLDMARQHGGVVARFGDKMWDVAHHTSLHTYLSHVNVRSCYLFLDPALKGTLSGKLPGGN